MGVALGSALLLSPKFIKGQTQAVIFSRLVRCSAGGIRRLRPSGSHLRAR